MKKIISFLIVIFSIIELSSTNLEANDKIGLNIKGLVGFGNSELESPISCIAIKSHLKFPQIIAGISYQIFEKTPVEIGIFYHYNAQQNFDDMDYARTNLNQLSVEILYTFITRSFIHPYMAIDFFPYSKLEMKNKKIDEEKMKNENLIKKEFKLNKTFLALSGSFGIQYSISDSFNLFTQVSYQRFFKKHVVYNVTITDPLASQPQQNQERKYDLLFTNINLMLGIGISL